MYITYINTHIHISLHRHVSICVRSTYLCIQKQVLSEIYKHLLYCIYTKTKLNKPQFSNKKRHFFNSQYLLLFIIIY